jgi:hypothetical protein
MECDVKLLMKKSEQVVNILPIDTIQSLSILSNVKRVIIESSIKTKKERLKFIDFEYGKLRTYFEELKDGD